MGIVLWLVSGAVAWAFARIVPLSRERGWIGELMVSVLAALVLGVVATALDFGGWREPDWRAGLFAVFGAFTAIGAFRLTIDGNPGGPSS